MENKGFMQISFGWLFALIVGGFVLFLAIFAVVQFMDTEDVGSDVVTSRDIGVLLNPLEIGFESGKSNSLSLNRDTRIFTKCDDGNIEEFGTQKISVSQFNLGKWSELQKEVGFENKYLFSENPAEGKRFLIFSKPFNFPFKVADLIYVLSKDTKYCFVKPDLRISEEIRLLRLDNIENVTNINQCSKGAKRVCFGNGLGCNSNDVLVRENLRQVDKQGKSITFEGDELMYAAIFSDPEVYDCQIQRLAKRADSLAKLYNRKSIIVSQENCNADFNLIGFANLLTTAKTQGSQGLTTSLINSVEEIKYANDLSDCRLW